MHCPGMPKTMDSFRFSDADKGAMSVSMRRQVGQRARFVKPPPVEAPPAAHQHRVEERHKGFAVHQDTLPPWAELVVQHRDTFLGTCIGLQPPVDSCLPDELFLVVLAIQQPRALFGFRATASPRHWPAVELLDAGQYMQMELGHHFYKLQNVCMSVQEFGLEDPDQLVVVEGVCCVEGGLQIRGDPVRLMSFACMHYGAPRRQPQEKGERAGKARVNAEVWAQLLHDYPWLDESDVRLAITRAPGVPAPHRPGEALIPVRLDEGEAAEAAFAHVQDELEQKREERRFSTKRSQV